MSWFRREKRADAEEEEIVSDPLLEAIVGPQKGVSEDNAMQIPTFAACVNFIADTISMLPVKLYQIEKSNEGRKIIKEVEADRRCVFLNVDGNDTLSATEVKRAIVKDYLIRGAAHVYIDKIGNQVQGLYYVDDRLVSTDKSIDSIFKDYIIYVDGKTYFPHNFVKILRSTTDGATGKGIVKENRKILEVAYNTLDFENSLVKNGGNKKGFLKAPNKLEKAVKESLKRAWKKLHSNGGDDIIVLQDGMDFKESSNTSAEMQLNENKATNKKEICSIFKIAPDVIDEKASDEVYNLTIKMAVLPIINEIENALDRDLLLETEKGSFYFAFDTTEVMKGDLEKRYSAYEKAVKAGWISKNEIRAKENMVAIDGLDIVAMSLGDVIYNIEDKSFFTPNTSEVLPAGGKGDKDKQNFAKGGES